MKLSPNLCWGLAIFLNLCCLAPAAASAGYDGHPGDATRGSLWLRDDGAHPYQAAPTLSTEVTMEITAMLARVQVRQTFHNPAAVWAEGIYVFPLPENSAVDHLRMRIGERVIEGQIKERDEAKKTYEKAKQAGQRASLVEQERPNIFTTSLANIAPGESIVVEIEYQQTVRYVDGVFRLRFPMVVGPRYIPGRPSGTGRQLQGFSGSGWAQATDQVPDAARITPPVQHPQNGPINPVTLDIQLNAGIPLTYVTSPYHGIEKQATAEGGYRIRLASGPVPADRDFELVWQPQAGSAPSAAWFLQQQGTRQFGLLMLVPPQQPGPTHSISRDVVFVIDTSGSMHGDSIKQARRALLLALERLTEQDRFNIIRFSHAADSLFMHTMPADAANLALGRNYVSSLQASGGTEMLPALEMALNRQQETHGVRQVIFLTDGSIGNERQLFKVIRKRLGDSRLFTVGIGSAPNSYFMSKAAEYGRGTFTHIGNTGEVMEKMSALFSKLEQPALTDIRLELPRNTNLDMLPRRLPDLYLGEPLLVAFQGPGMPEWLTVHGRFGGESWTSTVTLDGGREGAALAPEWGRRKIAELMTNLHDAETDSERQNLRTELVSTALAYHLVSRYTSLVAVDVTPARTRDELLAEHALKTNLPTGWSYEHVFGMPQTATPARLQLVLGLVLLVLASAGAYRLRRQAC